MLKIVNKSNEKIQSEFEDPYEMVGRAIRIIEEKFEIFTKYSINTSDNRRYLSFKEVGMDYGGANITIRIASVYENGIIYNLQCYPDCAAGNYDIPTTASLVCKDNGDLMFIVNCTPDQRSQIEAGLGKSINEELLSKISNFQRLRKFSFSRKQEELHKLKMENILKKIELIVMKSITQLMKVENNKKISTK